MKKPETTKRFWDRFRRSKRNEPTIELDEPTIEMERRLELLKFAYAEVLDATKHSDDKIGRLLTALAFLTGAALTIAGLNGAKYLARNFDAAPFTAPLAVLALGTFLVGILFAAMLLLAAFSAPLRLPGQRRLPKKEVDWVNRVPGSPIYFFEIANLSIARWREKLNGPVAARNTELAQSLEYEIHNLAARTTYKHRRITEASELVGFALLALAVSAILTLCAAVSPLKGPVELSLPQAIALGAVVATACFIQLYVRIREQRQTPDERLHSGTPGYVYALAVSCGVGSLVASAHTSIAFVILPIVAGLIASFAYWSYSFPYGESEEAPLERQARVGKVRASIVVTLIVAVGGAALAVTTFYGWRLIVALLAYVLLTIWPRLSRRPSKPQVSLDE